MSVEQYRGDMEMCCRCSACKHIPFQMIKNSAHSYICPSISRFNFHSYSGSGRVITGRDFLNNGFKFTDKMMHIIYNCQMCGGCDISCKYAMDMEVLAPINEIRIKAVKEGHTNEALDKVIANLRKTNS
ncbi:MAG TPA: 4Fe-4S dicluster domain-containing protein, partial [Dehalococcoidales bacterium]|nr:4Fe-4S dicluster domain-containing protein [Dehalococcoidales bacterium]